MAYLRLVDHVTIQYVVWYEMLARFHLRRRLARIVVRHFCF